MEFCEIWFSLGELTGSLISMYFPKFIYRCALPAYGILTTRSSQEEGREQRVVR